jgi:hypothetical protein
VVPPEADPPEPVVPPELLPPEPVDPPDPLFAPELLLPQLARVKQATRAEKKCLDRTWVAPSNRQ